jgi:hypothetical protein
MKLTAEVRDLCHDHAFVRITRRASDPRDNRIDGYIVGCSDNLVVVHRRSDRMDLDGYLIVRLRDVRTIQREFPRHAFFERAFQLKTVAPVDPGLRDISDIPTALRSVAERFPLVVLSCDRKYPNEVQIGQPTEYLKTRFRIRCIDPGADWYADEDVFTYSDIVSMEFGGEYEATLALVAGLTAPGPSPK